MVSLKESRSGGVRGLFREFAATKSFATGNLLQICRHLGFFSIWTLGPKLVGFNDFGLGEVGSFRSPIMSVTEGEVEGGFSGLAKSPKCLTEVTIVKNGWVQRRLLQGSPEEP